ncbi:MAG: G5 domain-containing protein [Ruminiclostridium sp.]|nr:G5 domain-containing protein [Ruminiclostridium sp.]
MLLKICGKNAGALPSAVTLLLVVFVMAAAILISSTKSYADTDDVSGMTVHISADGRSFTVQTGETTVGELLAREDIVLDTDDEINVPLTARVCENMTVSVSRVEYRTREKTTFIPHETEYTETPLLKIGDSEVRTEGVDGSVTITIEDKYVNGAKTSCRVTDTKMTDPVTEVIAEGTALQTPYSKREGNYRLENGIPTEYAYKLSGKVTSYTAPEGSGTYSGRPLVIGSVGVDPNVIPFGSEVYIVTQDGSKVYGYAIASDTGDITDIIADAYMGVTSEHWDDAMNWCAQFCDVYVLTVGDNSVSWR